MGAIKTITLIQDDREKKPWNKKYLGEGFRTEIKRLKVGDYTIKGMENLVRIERKANWEELAVNISATKNRTNFEKELLALQKFSIRLLIINDDYSSLASMRQYSKFVSSTLIANWMLKIELEYGISVIPVGARYNSISKYLVRNIFKEIANHNAKNRKFHYHIV